MSFTAAEIAEIMKLMESTDFDELTLEMAGVKLALRRRGPAVVATHRPEAWAALATAAAGNVAPADNVVPVSESVATPSPPQDAAASASLLDVLAPMLGTFYRAPKPGEPSFVAVGASVEPDTVIGIIEVMKLMNTVRAGVRGTVVEIVATDGTMVEYDAVLMRVRPAG